MLTNFPVPTLQSTPADGQNESFNIIGKINTIRKQEKAFYPDPDNLAGVRDSAVVKNVEFVFKGTITVPERAIL